MIHSQTFWIGVAAIVISTVIIWYLSRPKPPIKTEYRVEMPEAQKKE